MIGLRFEYSLKAVTLILSGLFVNNVQILHGQSKLAGVLYTSIFDILSLTSINY